MKQIAFIAPILVLVAMFLASCGDKNTQKETTVRYVKSAEVLPLLDNVSSIYNGEVKESREVTLSFKVGGPVNKLLVEAGDYVNKGQLIAQIDKRDYLIQVDASKAQYTQAKGEYERYMELYERKKLPKNTLEQLQAKYLMTKSQYEAATNALEDTELRAPFAGFISQKQIENFETVSPGKPIVKLLDMQHMEIVINVPETHIATINKDSRIVCDVRNAKEIEIPARVNTISKKSGRDGLFEVRVVLEGEVSHKIKPGMVAKVKVIEEATNNALVAGVLVPVESVFSEGKLKYVWVVDSSTNKVKKHRVSIKKLAGNGMLLISSNVKAGDVVVTAGVHSILENQEVKILPKKSETNIGGLL